tara:strand:- start:1100 stop:3709 length:2610 start_codon:yes stop_codon:yes gene_type:complete
MMSRRIAVFLVVLFLISTAQAVQSNSSGRTGSSTSGCSCHGSSSSMSVSLNGLPSSGYEAVTTYTLSWDGGPHIPGTGGFNLDVNSGSWSNLGNNVKLVNGELTHDGTSSRSWSADWTSPSAGSGTAVFTLAVLYGNGNGQNSGDSWDTGSWNLPESTASTNNPPNATNVRYVPSTPTKETGLGVEYDYNDDDGDSEQGTTIRWFRDGLQIAQIDDMKTVPDIWISKGQEWRVEVTPSDNEDQGETVSLSPIIIENTVPIARNLEINPESPTDIDDINLNYDYFDLDGDNEQDSQVRWYLDGVRISDLDDTLTVTSLMIRSGDEWEARVTPFDGTSYGLTKSTGLIVIGSSNSPPTANAYISQGSNAYTDDALQVIVGWFDSDGDNLAGTEIRWFRDGYQVSAFNDLNWVTSDATAKNQVWYASVRVSDSLVWSEWVDADSITILNSPPEVTSITMLPEGNLTANQDLTVIWEQSDLDGDSESGSEIYWMINGEREPEFDGLLTIPSESVYRDQHWSVQVIPRDGEDLGSSMTTPSRVIMNGAPEIPIINLGSGTTGYLGEPDSFPELGIANSLEDLVVLASSIDPDEEPLFFDVIWYRNGYQVPELDGESLVPSERLEPGQIWEVKITARDPWGLSSQSSAIIEVSNLPPIPSWSTIPEISISGSMIIFDGSSSIDPDGTINNWLWQINGQSFPGSSAEILLGEGTHTVKLTVTDNFGSSITIQDLYSLGTVSMVSDLNSEISGTDIELTWSGNAEEYHIYRSSYSTETLDEMQLVGITNENNWNEIAPIASDLYYAVTIVVGDNEILWLDNGTNTISVDAKSVVNHVDDSPTGSITILSIPLTIIFLILAVSSLVISLRVKKRRSES